MGLSSVLSICKEALSTQQSCLAVTANNIANVNTTGYSRQNPVLATNGSVILGGISYGTGVQLTNITKSYDQFLGANIAREKTTLGKLETEDDYLTRVETLFTESEDSGLNALLEDFWAAWEDLSANPEGSAERAVVMSAGESLAAAFVSRATELESLQTDANNEIVTVVAEVNSLTSEIASLNNQILQAETAGVNANDLTDQRTVKIEELSELMDITILSGSNGQTTILSSSGNLLVSENLSWDLTVSADTAGDGFYTINYSDGKTAVDITDSISGGALRGLIEIRDEIIPAYSEQLDELAAAVITEVNQIHYAGYGLDGSSGNNFFTPCAATTGAAKTMSMSLSDTDKIAAGQSTETGDNSNALALAELKDAAVMLGGTCTMGEYYAILVSNVGTDVSAVQNSLASAQSLLDTYEERRASISGVSLDEETINLMKYQQAYTAASKLIAIIDEMMETLLSIK